MCATPCSQIIEEIERNSKDEFIWRAYELLGIERKHRQIFVAKDAGGGERKVNKKEDDWIDKFDKKVIEWVIIIGVSMVTAFITTLALTM